jgi:hypothetical protein
LKVPFYSLNDLFESAQKSFAALLVQVLPDREQEVQGAIHVQQPESEFG